MKYVKFSYSNGYAGCEEDYFCAFDDSISDEELQNVFEDFLNGYYNFSEPDDRFCDCDDETAIEDYYNEVKEDSYWTEVSKEEWEENNGEEYW